MRLFPKGTRLRLSTDRLFAKNHLVDDLANRTARGGAVTAVSQLTRFALQAVSIIALARLVSPADFGLVGMVAVVVGLAEVLKDAGLSISTVQRDEVTHDQLSTIFWVSLAVIAVVTFVVAGLAPLVAAFYGRAELQPMTLVLAAAFFVNGLSVQHDALMRRHMRFDSVAVTQVVPVALSLVASVAAALLGWRYWSLVAGTLVASVSSTALSFWLCAWVPGRPRRGTGAREMIRFGGDLTAFNVVNYFARNADYILIGRFLGAAGLGLYTKAYQIFMLPVTQIRAPIVDVALPALSALKHVPERYARYYRTIVGALALLAVPVAAYCIVETDFVVSVVLGARWSGAAPILRVLAVAGLVQAVASTRGLILISLGSSRRYLVLGVANSMAMVTSFAIGLRWGILGVATAYAVANFLVLVPTLLYTFKGTPITMPMFVGALVPPVSAGVLASVALMLVRHLTSGIGWTSHVISIGVFALVYVLAVTRSSSVRETWKVLVGSLRSRPAAEAEALL